MNSGDDGEICCLLDKLSWSTEKIVHRLECRFKRNSLKTSFDFKSLLPEQSAESVKISHSTLKWCPIVIKSMEHDDDDENVSSESSSDEDEEISSTNDQNEDVQLDRLARWEPGKSSMIVESEEENDDLPPMNENITQVDPLDLPTETPTTEVEDLLVTFVHHPIKTEPISYDSDLPQLDGQTDFCSNKKKKTDPSSSSAWEHLTHAEQELNSYQKSSTDKQKIFPVHISTQGKLIHRPSNVDFHQQIRPKKRVQSKSKRTLPMEHSGKTILDYFKVIKRSSTNENIRYSPVRNLSGTQSKIRPANYFDGCIVVDDEDEAVIPAQTYYPISATISSREKLLDHAVHSPGMRVKWLLNVEFILLEHISNYSQRSEDSNYSSLISMIIVNFLKIFVVRNSDENELAFQQFGFTSYLRYLLVELPTSKHRVIPDENDCSECQQYSVIIKILFDLLFDLMECDLCQISHRENYRSSLIEEDYFKELQLKKKNSFSRIKWIIYLIELIGIHRNKCSKKKDFLDNGMKIFQWMEDLIQQIFYRIDNSTKERISICFNVMELALLFVDHREQYAKQMAIFLAKLAEVNSIHAHLILFDENLLPEIRLLLINELIDQKFEMKLTSFEDFEAFFQRIQMVLKSPNPIDDFTFVLLRSLFHSYADLLICAHDSISSLFRLQLEQIYCNLINLSNDSNYFEQIKRTVILFRLLKSKWSRL